MRLHAVSARRHVACASLACFRSPFTSHRLAGGYSCTCTSRRSPRSQDGGGNGVVSHIVDAIGHNKTSAGHVALYMRRLFRARLKLGMLDPPASPRVAALNRLHYNTTELKPPSTRP